MTLWRLHDYRHRLRDSGVLVTAQAEAVVAANHRKRTPVLRITNERFLRGRSQSRARDIVQNHRVIALWIARVVSVSEAYHGWLKAASANNCLEIAGISTGIGKYEDFALRPNSNPSLQ